MTAAFIAVEVGFSRTIQRDIAAAGIPEAASAIPKFTPYRR